MNKKIFYLILVMILLTGILSAQRLPTVGGDTDNWGTILNEYLGRLAGNNATELNQTMVNGSNIYASAINGTHIYDGTINDADISDTTNLTLGEKITFTLGGVIDNIISGWVTLTGNLNITGNISASYFIGDGSQLTGISTYNSTYENYAYNQTYSGSTYNATYENYAYNQTTPANSYTDAVNASQSSWITNTFAKLLGGNEINGTQNFNGGWLNNGVSIIGGAIYAQVAYFYNITSLNVTQQDLTILNNFTVGTNTLHANPESGNIGIGTISPNQKLEVNGSVNVSQNIYAGSYDWISSDDYNIFDGKNLSSNTTKFDERYYTKSQTYNQTEVNDLIPSTLTYHFWDTTSTVNASYKVMNATVNPTATNHTANSLSNGDVIVWRLNENTNLTGLDGEALRLHTSGTKTGGTKDLQIVGKLSKRLNNGTIVLIATTDTSPILINNVFTNINLFSYVQPQTLNVSDQLLWRLEAVVTGAGTDPSVVITVGGLTQNGLDLPVSVGDIVITESDPIFTAENASLWAEAQNKFNATYDSKADYQFNGNNFNGSGNFTTSGNISASYFIGDGSQLTGISGGIWTNVSGTATYYGNVNVTGNLSLGNGQITFNDSSKTFNYYNGSNWYPLIGSVPVNTISAFNQANCPAGWILADGTSGTPDLRGIFIRGAGTNGVLSMGNGTAFSAIYGNYQNDSLEAHQHIAYQEFTDATSGSGQTRPYYAGYAGGTTRYTNSTTGRASGETAPASYALIYCMKTAEDSPTSNSIWQETANTILPVNNSKNFVINNSNLFVNVTSGRVGIGTTTPSFTLEVRGQIAWGTSAALGKLTESGGNPALLTGSNLNLNFFTAPSGSATQRMTILSGGNVGIGTASPNSKLTVSQVNSASTEGIRVLQGANYLEIYENGAGILQYNGGNYIAIDSGGIGIGIVSPITPLEVVSSTAGNLVTIIGTSSTYPLSVTDSSNTCDFGVTGTGWTASCTSDEKLKNNIRDIPQEVFDKMADYVFNYPLKQYEWKSNNQTTIGAIAQDIQALDSTKVHDENGTLYITSPSINDLIISIKKLFNWNTNQDSEIQNIKSDNQAMKTALCELNKTEFC